MNNQETLKEEMRTNFTQVMENAKELFYMTTETYTAFDQERTRYITHKPTTQQALEMLKVVGVTTLEIRFYGGHDNGDVEEIIPLLFQQLDLLRGPSRLLGLLRTFQQRHAFLVRRIHRRDNLAARIRHMHSPRH